VDSFTIGSMPSMSVDMLDLQQTVDVNNEISMSISNFGEDPLCVTSDRANERDRLLKKDSAQLLSLASFDDEIDHISDDVLMEFSKEKIGMSGFQSEMPQLKPLTN